MSTGGGGGSGDVEVKSLPPRLMLLEEPTSCRTGSKSSTGQQDADAAHWSCRFVEEEAELLHQVQTVNTVLQLWSKWVCRLKIHL